MPNAEPNEAQCADLQKGRVVTETARLGMPAMRGGAKGGAGGVGGRGGVGVWAARVEMKMGKYVHPTPFRDVYLPVKSLMVTYVYTCRRSCSADDTGENARRGSPGENPGAGTACAKHTHIYIHIHIHMNTFTLR